MVKIKAAGKRNGKKLTIEVVDSVTYIDGEEDDIYDVLIHEQFPMGGTYYAEPDSMENILNTLSFHFFDEKPKISTDGEFEEMPYVEGRIY